MSLDRHTVGLALGTDMHGVYLNGELIEQDRHLTAERLLQVLTDYGIVDHSVVQDVFEGELPDTWEEL